MRLEIPELSLVVLIGPSGCGKSTFAVTHFAATEVLSSDTCRGLIADDENDQSASIDAFELLHHWLDIRLKRGRLTVVDATNVEPLHRKTLLEIAKKRHVLATAIVFDLPQHLCVERNATRPDRDFGPHVIRRQASNMKRSLPGLRREGFRHIYTLKSTRDVEDAEIVRTPLWNDRKSETGPFDVIGDIHGCRSELEALLAKLGYALDTESAYRHPEGRKAVFLGDLVDRGPDSPGVLRIAMAMVEAGQAFAVPGNHDVKLVRKLSGRDVKVAHGLFETLEQLDKEPPEFKEAAAKFLDGLVSHLVLDEGKLVVAHAGLKEEMQGRASMRVRDFCLYGETTGEIDEFGLPVRYPWALEYRGAANVVYGHTPVPEAEWLNRTINIDTGCVFGGKLTALRYPERELVSVPALEVYAESIRPIQFESPERDAQQMHDDVLDLADISGRRYVQTPIIKTVILREEQTYAAIEIMSRFAVDPKWLIYLPPTMSPSETSAREDYLEHPDEAFAYFRSQEVGRVVCEEKHMGSRAVVIVLRTPDVAITRFGHANPSAGTIYTRTGRRFFEDESLETALLERLRDAVEKAGLWDELNTDWLCLDCELMPWSAKALELLRKQFAPVGAAARRSLAVAKSDFDRALNRLEASEEGAGFREALAHRLANAERYTASYRRYCWPVDGLQGIRLAPFHLMASEGKVHTNRDHRWHMETLARICREEPDLLHITPYREIALNDTEAVDAATRWWTELTESGGEGMVVKPIEFLAKGPKDWVQPALKCRGREYLRIIYGPDYDEPENLARLRSRAVGRKRSLALREFAMGLEALERFVRKEPLRRVHECVFGVLALESEPIDARL